MKEEEVWVSTFVKLLTQLSQSSKTYQWSSNYHFHAISLLFHSAQLTLNCLLPPSIPHLTSPYGVLDSSIVFPSSQDLVASLEVAPGDVIFLVRVQATHGFDAGITQGFWQWISSIELAKTIVPGFFIEILLLALPYGKDESVFATFKSIFFHLSFHISINIHDPEDNIIL